MPTPTSRPCAPQATPAPADIAFKAATVEIVPEVPQPPAPEPAVAAEAEATPAEQPAEILPEDSAALAEPVPMAEAETSADPGPVAADNPFLNDEAAAEPEPPPSTPRRLLAAAACLLLLTGLAAQALYFYRGEIASRHALAREWLGAACAGFGCTVEPPQRPKSLLIEASDLQSVDPARPDRIQLTATLRNHAGFVVAYPALDLVLTNVNDHTLARRIFLPQRLRGLIALLAAGLLQAYAEISLRFARL